MDDGPRILFVCSGLLVGGAERQWSILIPALRDRGFDVSVLTLVDAGPFFDELLSRGIPASCARMRSRADLAGVRRALRHAESKPDLVVTHSINAHVIGHLIARRAGVPHVSTEHFNVGPGAPTRAHRKALARLVGPRVDRAISVTPAQIPRLLALGYRPERISVIANGVPEPTPSKLPSFTRSRFDVHPDEFLAVLVATLRPEKNADVFLRAVQAAHRVNPGVWGLIVGGGPERERLRKLADEDGVVQVLGERSDVPDIVKAADTVCLSSSAEGVPMVLLEAMALGKPIVATDVGGVADAVEHEKTGLLVPFENDEAFASALLRLASNRALAERLGHAARERHRSLFSVERMIADYARVLQEVIDSARPADGPSVTVARDRRPGDESPAEPHAHEARPRSS